MCHLEINGLLTSKQKNGHGGKIAISVEILTDSVKILTDSVKMLTGLAGRPGPGQARARPGPSPGQAHPGPDPGPGRARPGPGGPAKPLKILTEPVKILTESVKISIEFVKVCPHRDFCLEVNSPLISR